MYLHWKSLGLAVFGLLTLVMTGALPTAVLANEVIEIKATAAHASSGDRLDIDVRSVGSSSWLALVGKAKFVKGQPPFTETMLNIDASFMDLGIITLRDVAAIKQIRISLRNDPVLVLFEVNGIAVRVFTSGTDPLELDLIFE